jgi:adenylate kinase
LGGLILRNLLFVGGIHGVGKTTFCNEIIASYKVTTYSASKIISSLKKQNLPLNKLIPDIDINQALLIEGLKQIPPTEELIILDGHFCLIDDKRAISKISETVFKEIQPSAFIVITDTVENVASRLKTRDHINYDRSFLELFQNEELAHAKNLTSELQIPICIYDQTPESKHQFHAFITKLGVIR